MQPRIVKGMMGFIDQRHPNQIKQHHGVADKQIAQGHPNGAIGARIGNQQKRGNTDDL